MGGSYTADEQSAAKMTSAIADDPDELIVGVITMTTSQTTSVLAHGLTGAPDFLIYSLQADANGPLNMPGLTVNTTSVTFTLSTAQANWSVDYIIGYTA